MDIEGLGRKFALLVEFNMQAIFAYKQYVRRCGDCSLDCRQRLLSGLENRGQAVNGIVPRRIQRQQDS